MANQDNLSPFVSSTSLNVVLVTDRSISIQWEPATDDKTPAQDIRYVVGLKESENPEDPWHIVQEEKGLCGFTFKNLKSDTRYAFYVMAFDEDGNMTQYPLANGSMSAKTLAPDTTAPTVKNRNIKVTATTLNSISIQWEPATDNVTHQSRIRYQVWLTMTEEPSDPWKMVEEKIGLTSYTFKDLKSDTNYAFYVRAFDEAGNSLLYPLDNGCMMAKTKASIQTTPNSFSGPSRKVQIRQSASVLQGTDTISLELTYSYATYIDGKITEYTGVWTHKWSNNEDVNDIIRLPAGGYFTKNLYHITIRSRRGALPGLNKWKVCSEGDMIVIGDTIRLVLSGSYYSFSVKYTLIQ